MTLSICATNYNCAHALRQHLDSVFGNLEGMDFEYVVVDNRSRDGSLEILQQWARTHANVKVLSKRSTMGQGRQIAFGHSTGDHIMVLDTDVVYSQLLRRFTESYFAAFSKYSLQAIFGAIFPRFHWEIVGGRRSLNTNEDVDMWVRLWRRDLIRWSLVVLGANLKEPNATGSYDHLSTRYSRPERVLRLFGREFDLWKTKQLVGFDIDAMIVKNTVDLALGPKLQRWPHSRGLARAEHPFVDFFRQIKLTISQP